MAIAQVIGGAHQFERVGAGDVQQRLGTGDYADDAAVFGLQAFAVMQGGLAAFEEQADVLARAAETAQAAFAAGLEAQFKFGIPVRLGGNTAVNHQHGAVSGRSMPVIEQVPCQAAAWPHNAGCVASGVRNEWAFQAALWCVRYLRAR